MTWKKICSDGTIEWCRNSKLHRVGGPARIYTNGSVEWWIDGLLHRDDGPAVQYVCGYARWHKHGHPHCLHGPALILACGHWHRRGVCNTTDGPDPMLLGRQEWHVDGRQFTEDEFIRYVDTQTGEILIPPGRTLINDSSFNLQAL